MMEYQEISMEKLFKKPKNKKYKNTKNKTY